MLTDTATLGGGSTKRVFAVVSVVALIAMLFILHSEIKDFIWTHPWWHSFLVAIPVIALPVLAYLEWRDSHEANNLRREANQLRAELDHEGNKHLEQIAQKIERPASQAQRNAETLRGHLREHAKVSEGEGDWGNSAEIVDVSADHVVTLFVPQSYTSTVAYRVMVHCGDLEITEMEQGSCHLHLRVLKRYGPHHVDMGEITRWDDRFQPATTPTFNKGAAVAYAQYRKPGSAETRGIYIYSSKDVGNCFLLVRI